MQDKSIAAAYASDEGTEGKIIPLRPHHGMCLAYFKGEGYSNGFTAHMSEMLKIFLEGKKIRKKCGLKAGQTLHFSEFTKKVQEKILATDKRKEICGNCQWNSICEEQKSRWA